MCPREDYDLLLGVINHFPGSYQRASSIAAGYPAERQRRTRCSGSAGAAYDGLGHGIAVYGVVENRRKFGKLRAGVRFPYLGDSGAGQGVGAS